MRKAFVLYTSDMQLMDKLTIEQRGILITAIAAYTQDREVPDMDPATDMLFSHIANEIDRDTEKYEQTVERRREAARKRWSMQMYANAGVEVEDKDEEEVDVEVFHNTRTKRKGRNKRPAEQHDYDFQKIEADLLRRQREGLGT